MTITLACTWQPRGELPRFLRLWPRLRQIYAAIFIALPPDADPALTAPLAAEPGVHVYVTREWGQGRHTAVTMALAAGATHIHYIDLDRALRWAETQPDELAATAARVQTSDCLIIGRTEAAWATHPQAMRQTEALFNQVFSHLLGVEADFGAGSRGLSRAAVETIAQQAEPVHWADTTWPVLLQQAGFRLDSLLVDGLDWETPDHDQPFAVDAATQRRAAQAADADPVFWAQRVRVADGIMRAGLAAWERSRR